MERSQGPGVRKNAMTLETVSLAKYYDTQSAAITRHAWEGAADSLLSDTQPGIRQRVPGRLILPTLKNHAISIMAVS